MLQVLRDKSQGVVAVIICGFIAITFGLWGVHNYFGNGGNEAPVVKVNGHKITQQALTVAFQRFRQIQAQQHPQFFSTQKKVDAVKKKVLNSLITTSLLTQSAHKNGFGIGQEQLMFELAKLPAFQVNGEFSKLRFEQFLSGMMYSQQQFFHMLNNTMLLAQTRVVFTGSSFALPYQVKKTYQLINQKRSFNYIFLPTKAFFNKVTLSPNAIEDYYKAHPQQFTTPEKVSVEYLALSLSKLMKAIKPTDAQLHSYYENNLNHFTTPKHWTLAHILIATSPEASPAQLNKTKEKAENIAAQLKKGGSFSALAAKYSDDLATAKQGGVMKLITLLEVNKTWQQQIVALQKPGQIAAPFKTRQGFEILKLVKTTTAVVKPYSQVEADVLKFYRQENAEKQFAHLSDELSNITFEHPSSLAPAAKQLNLSIQSTGLFDKKGGDTAFLKKPQVLQAAFSDDVLNNGNNSDAVQVNDETIIVLRVKQKMLAKVKPLSDVKQTITDQLKQQQAAQKAKAAADNMLAAVQSGKTLASVKENFADKSVNKVLRNQVKGVNPAIADAAFNLGLPKKGHVSATVKKVGDMGYAVIAVSQVNDPNPTSMTPVMQREFSEGVNAGLGHLDYFLYKKGLKASADIKYYDKKDK